MKKRELNSKDLLLCFLYSPGITQDCNEPIVGRTRLTKMMYLFEKEIYHQFFEDSMTIELPNFEAYYYGPFSKKLFEDLSFFVSIGLIVEAQTNIPLSDADKIEYQAAYDQEIVDEWADATFEDSTDNFEMSYLLSQGGNNYVATQLWESFTDAQKIKLKQFKAQINKISLDALLRYVYNKYPEDAKKSLIADKYIE